VLWLLFGGAPNAQCVPSFDVYLIVNIILCDNNNQQQILEKKQDQKIDFLLSPISKIEVSRRDGFR